MPHHVSRRDFIVRSAAGAGAAVGVVGASAAAAGYFANQRLRIGFVGTGQRGQAHIEAVLKLRAAGHNVEAAAVCDVFNKYREQAAARIRLAGSEPRATGDYRELLADPDLDAVLVATPDHWHARATLDALAAGKHVYCERPLVHRLDEAAELLAGWRDSGRVVQVGVQSASDGRWQAARDFIAAGEIGPVVHAQTEYFRNSGMGQWRSIGLSRDMTPRNVDWKMYLGLEQGLAPEMPFDRALFAQWRCYWPFGHGLYSELFGPQIARLQAALGVGAPRRVASSGGIYRERDGRDVPDTATLVADYDEGLQLLATATLANDHKIEQCIRGHHGTLVFDLSRDGFDFLPQRPQVTRVRDAVRRHVAAPQPADETVAHWENFLQAIALDDPSHCRCTPEAGAAAAVTAILGAESYRSGRMLEWDAERLQAVESGGEYARRWEERSRDGGAPPNGQRLEGYQRLAGPWASDDADPAA